MLLKSKYIIPLDLGKEMQQDIIQSFSEEQGKASYIAKFISDHIDDYVSREFAAEAYTAHKSIILKFKSDWLQETSSMLLKSKYISSLDLGIEMQQSIIQSFVHEKEKADYIAKFISDHIDASSSRLFEFIAEETPIGVSIEDL
jgi:ethanolamine ammonia-lyase small subunit